MLQATSETGERKFIMSPRHLIDLADLSVSAWEEITRLACDIRERTDEYLSLIHISARAFAMWSGENWMNRAVRWKPCWAKPAGSTPRMGRS